VLDGDPACHGVTARSDRSKYPSLIAGQIARPIKQELRIERRLHIEQPLRGGQRLRVCRSSGMCGFLPKHIL
jgi:hypothetical protein